MSNMYPGRTVDNTGYHQLQGLLAQIPKLEEMKASYLAAALGPVIAREFLKIFGAR